MQALRVAFLNFKSLEMFNFDIYILILLTLHAGYFSMPVLLYADYFFKINFKKNQDQEKKSLSNSSVSPELCPKYLQRLSADLKSHR